MTRHRSIKITEPNKAFLQCAHDALDAAGLIIRNAFRQKGHRLKEDASPVTQADYEAELAIRAVISSYFPKHGILGEETEALHNHAPYQWIIDPIDGTRAFACGHMSFGSLLGCYHAGTMVLGMIDQPVIGERWWGDGTQSYCNDVAIHTSTASLEHAKLASTAPELIAPSYRQRFHTLQDNCAIMQWGGDCMNYALLASGCIDIVAETGLKPYDILPILPILQGAGASISDWDGQPLSPDHVSVETSAIDILVSANATLHHAALAKLRSDA